MSEPQEDAEPVDALPEANVRRNRWQFSIVWLVPLVAVIAAGVLVFDRVREWGPQITIQFKDASGLRTGQTQLKYRGVPIGEVTAIDLGEDHRHALVTCSGRQCRC